MVEIFMVAVIFVGVTQVDFILVDVIMVSWYRLPGSPFVEIKLVKVTKVVVTMVEVDIVEVTNHHGRQGKGYPAAVPSGYPNPTRYPIFLSIPDPTRFSFRNHRVAGNPKHWVLPDISGKPEVSGTTRYFGYHP